jgi:hypothetical protein
MFSRKPGTAVSPVREVPFGEFAGKEQDHRPRQICLAGLLLAGRLTFQPRSEAGRHQLPLTPGSATLTQGHLIFDGAGLTNVIDLGDWHMIRPAIAIRGFAVVFLLAGPSTALTFDGAPQFGDLADVRAGIVLVDGKKSSPPKIKQQKSISRNDRKRNKPAQIKKSPGSVVKNIGKSNGQNKPSVTPRVSVLVKRVLVPISVRLG